MPSLKREGKGEKNDKLQRSFPHNQPLMAGKFALVRRELPPWRRRFGSQFPCKVVSHMVNPLMPRPLLDNEVARIRGNPETRLYQRFAPIETVLYILLIRANAT